MKSRLFPVDPRGLDGVAEDLLTGTPVRDREADLDGVPSPAKVQKPESYIILPGKSHGTYSYSDTLITMDRVHLGKTWYQAHEELHKDKAFMLNLRQYADFLNLLKSGQPVHDGKGNRIDSAKVIKLFKDITEQVDPYRAEWLDADFKVITDVLHMHYDHKFVNGQLKPQKTERLENCLMEDCYMGIASSNRQGLPTRKARDGIYYWHPRSDNDSVAWFCAFSVRVSLGCNRVPRSSGAGLGVRVAKIR